MADEDIADTSGRLDSTRTRLQSVTLGKGAPVAAAQRKVWLNALVDPVAGLSAYSPCMHTCNLFGDGEWRLVIADSEKKLKVWKGMQKQSENTLLDTATAITSFISEVTQPKLPFLAVASGSHVYIYRNLRPFYKFVLPPEPVDPKEQEAWSTFSSGGMTLESLESALADLQASGAPLAQKSVDLLAFPDETSKQDYIKRTQGQPLAQSSYITCMIAIKEALDEVDATSCLIVGTESKEIVFLNHAGTSVTKTLKVGGVPAFLAGTGVLEVSYTLAVAARDSKVYLIKNGEVQNSVIQLDSMPVGVAISNKNVIVACMNETVHSFRLKGQKNYSLYLPAAILVVQMLNVQSHRNAKCIAVALANGEVRVYNEKQLVSTHTVPSPVTGITFGRYGREDNTLITIMRNGTLDIKIMPRTAQLEVNQGISGPPPEQDIPLQVPKKTRLYVEQTQREREQAVDMHCAFQRDLCKLRLATARAFVKVLTDGQGASSFTASANLSVNASVQGLGPRFKVSLILKNDGQTPIINMVAKLIYNEALYQADKRVVLVPLLVPTLQYIIEVSIVCKDPMAGPDSVRIILANSTSSVPYLTALLKMPMSELDE